MNYINFAIQNPVKVTVAVMLTLLAGMLALNWIPVQLTPNVDQPIITIATNWTGRSPDEIEREIIEEQEDKLKSISGIRKMSATAFEGSGSISLEFNVAANMDEAVRDVSDKLREVPDYPADVDEPVITVAASSAETPIAWTVLTCEDPTFEVAGLRDLAADYIKPHLERIGGLSEVKVYGGRERQVHIQVHPQRLAQRGITYTELRDKLRDANVNMSAGSLADGHRDVRVRAVGRYDDLEQIRQTIIAYRGGGPVRVADVAKVTLTLEKKRGFVRSKGRPALALPAYREAGSNVMQVMEQIKGRIREIQTDIIPRMEIQAKKQFDLKEKPKFHYEQVYDETIYIEDAIDLVQNNIWIGGILAAIVLLIFLRSLTPTIIVALAIPVSVVGTFVAMTAAGRSINVVSLAGLAFAVGMVVDAAIVVLENIDRHLNEGKAPFNAALDGTREVWGAILASTLTTIAVFVPVLFLAEEAGQLFRDISLAICAAVLLSLIVSISVIPTAGAHWLIKRGENEFAIARAIRGMAGIPVLFNRLIAVWAGLLHWMTKPTIARFGIRLAIVAVLTTASFVGVWLLTPPATYLPSGNQNLVFGFIMTPPSYTKQHDATIANRVEAVVRPYWEAKNYRDTMNLPPVINKYSGQPIENIPPLDNYFFVTITQGMFTGAISHDKQNVKPVASLLTTAIGEIPGAYGGAFQRSLFSRGLGGGNRIDVEVTGFDMNEIRSSASSLYGALAREFGFMAVRPNPMNFNLPGPERQFELDRVQAANLDIDETELGLTVQTLVDGTIVRDFRQDGKSIDILMVRDPEYAMTIDTIGMVPMAAKTPDGQMITVPLSSISQSRRAEASQTILRIEEQRAVSLEVTPPADVPLEKVQSQIQEIEAELREQNAIAPAINVFQAGSADKLTQVRQSLIGRWQGWTWESVKSIGPSRLFLALLVTYLLMAALFESFLYPFVIMFSVPLAAVGGFIGLAVVRMYDPTQQFDVLTMLGFVILIGVVVNNAILIVHQALNFIRRGEDMAQSIRLSVQSRVRPVFMTTLTSVCGMLPLVVMPGSGSELYRGLGGVVIGGLIVSTVFTLVLVPLVFSLVLDVKTGLYKMLGRPSAKPHHTTIDAPA